MVRRLAWAFALLLSARPAFAETVVLDAVLRGRPGVVSSDAEYAVGSDTFEIRNVFVFDLSVVADAITAAKLVVVNPPGGFESPQRRETFAVHAVSLDVAANPRRLFEDVGEGALLGSIEVDEDSPAALEIPLVAPILRVFERADGVVALGGRLTTLRKLDGKERLFAGTGPGSGVSAPQLVLTTDPEGQPAASTVLHVNAATQADPGDGSVDAPLRSIAVALDLAAPGDVVQVAAGSYGERALLRRGVELRGSGAEETVIDVTLLAPDGIAVLCEDDALIDGFRIVDPWTTEVSYGNAAAAIDCSNGTSPEVTHNVIETPLRSAIWLGGSSAWIHHNSIQGGGGASETGATIFSDGGVPVIEDNEIASNGLALIAAPSEDAAIRRNLFRGLVVVRPQSGPAELTISDNLFLSERSLSLGGLLERASSGSALRILGNTFHGTSGIELQSSDATIANNLLVNGTAGINPRGNSVEIRHNDVFGNRAGFMGATTNYVGIDDQTGSDGNISEDPDFVDAFFEDFRLRPASPAVGAGANGDVAGDEDFDGDPRVVDVVDMGAQEHQPGEELPLPPLPIEVDLLPGKSPNVLKFTKVAKGSGKVALAILSDDELDAPADVDVATLILDREPALRCSDKDVDRDDRRDLVCSFPLRGISLGGWPLAVPPACVRGATHGGRKLLGCDEVEIDP